MKTIRVVVITILLTAIIIPVYPIYSVGQDELPIAGQSFSTIPAEIKQIDLSNMIEDGKIGSECVIFVQNARGFLIRDAKKRREGNDNRLPTLTGKSYPGLEKSYSDRGSAFMMYRVAEDEGLHVEKNLPRVGSILVYDRQPEMGMKDGHVAIVTKVDYDPDKKTVSLTTRDSNSKGFHTVRTNSLEFMPNLTSPKVRDLTNDKEYKILGFVQEEEKAFEKNRSIAENLVREDFLYVLGRDFGNDPKDKMNFYVDRYMQGVERKQVQDYIKVWYADEIQKRNQAVLDYQYSLKKLRDNLIRERASTATDETNKSIFRRTIEGLPEAAKDVFSILTAQASTTSYGASDSLENATTVSQTQNTIGVENDPPWNMSGRPTSHWGFMLGMLTQDPAGSGIYGKGYDSGDNLSNLDSSNIRAFDKEGRVMTLDGSSSPPRITSLQTSTGTATGGIPVSVSMNELGHNSFMEWGYWLQNNFMQAGGANYYFENSYYVKGDYTTNAQMQALYISGKYNGNAYATYWAAPGGPLNKADMSGNFSADVNFSSKTLSNINISVSGNSHSASISSATASFTGGSSTFVGNSDGHWKIDGVTAGSGTTKNLNGSFYGPNAKAIGGAFGINTLTTPTKYVTGAFQGSR